MIRRAQLGDEVGIARVHVETWRTAYAGIVPASFLASISEEKRQKSWQQQLSNDQTVVYVAVDGEEIIGFASGGVSRDVDGNGAAELYAIYILPERWGTGLAQCLLKTIEEELPNSPTTTLWVLQENQRATLFYEKHGFRFDGSEKKHDFDDVFLLEIRMRKQNPSNRRTPRLTERAPDLDGRQST